MRDPYSVEMVGHDVGSYRITGKLGQGGMGAVYSAEHTLLGRRAAVKVLLPELCRDQEMVTRFFNEARAAAAIRHPGIVEIYDFGYHRDGNAYIVMEYLEGETLSHRMRRIRPMPVSAALFVCSQISGVLAAAHAIGILHRDLKPDNIFLVPDPDVPGGERAKLLDFGIAKLTDSGESASVKTRTGVLMGSPAYMSPEQCKGAGQVREASDLYALGCILYEMLCGEPPFLAAGAGEVIAQHIFREPVPLGQRAPHVGPAIDDLVSRLLAKDPANRPRGATELKAELDRQRDSLTGPGRVGVETDGLPTVVLPGSPMVVLPGPAPSGTGRGTTGSAVAGAVPTYGTGTGVGRRRIRVMVALAGAMALGGGALATWRGGRGGNASEATLATPPAPSDAPAPSPPAPSDPTPSLPAPSDPTPSLPAPSDPAPSDPAPPERIKITIVSRPDRVQVYRPPKNVAIGVTPYELEIAPKAVTLEFLLRKPGYRDLAIEVPGNETRTHSFELERRRRKAGAPPTRLDESETGKPPILDPFERDRAAEKLDPFKK